MPIPLFFIFAAAAIAGTTIAIFWEELEKWFVGAVGSIIDSINKAIEVTSDAYASLIKEGYHYFKEVRVFSRDTKTGINRSNCRREEVVNLPPEVQAQLDREQKIHLNQYPT